MKLPRWDRLVTLYLVQPVGRIGGGSGPALTVLMYHSIADQASPSQTAYYETTTSPAMFDQHLASLRVLGYRSVDLETGLNLVRTNNSDAGKSVVITFDDGFRDFFTAAFPALQLHGFTATMYLPTGFIGDKPRSFNGRQCLSWSEVRTLREAGMRFGSHTVTHPKLYECSWKQIETELAESKDAMQQELGESIRDFAYPYAFPQQDRNFTARFTDLLQSQGYLTCVTTAIGRVRVGDNPYLIKRLPCNNCDDEALFRAKLQGDYDWLAGPQSAFKKVRRLASRRAALAGRDA